MAEYIAGMNYELLSEAVLKLAPVCEHCDEPKTHICLEKCCVDHSVFCQLCEVKCHLSHRTNKLELLFFNRKKIQDPDEYIVKSLNDVLGFIHQAKNTVTDLISRYLELSECYDKNIREIQRLLATCDRDAWYDRLYTTVEAYLIGENPLKQAREEFRKGLAKVNIHRSKNTSLDTTINLMKSSEQLVKSVDTLLQKFELFVYSNGPENHLTTQLMKYSLQNYLADEPLKNMSMAHRSCELDDTSSVTVFPGKRLRICASKNKFNIKQYPHLTEFHTQRSFTRYMNNLLALGMPVDLNNSENFLQKIPESVIKLSLLMMEPTSNHVDRITATARILAANKNLTKLKHLCIWFDTQREIPKSCLKILIQFALSTELRSLSIFNAADAFDWKTFSPKNSNKGRWEPMLNHPYRRTLHQIMLMERSKFMRCMPIACKEFMLEATDAATSVPAISPLPAKKVAQNSTVVNTLGPPPPAPAANTNNVGMFGNMRVTNTSLFQSTRQDSSTAATPPLVPAANTNIVGIFGNGRSGSNANPFRNPGYDSPTAATPTQRQDPIFPPFGFKRN